MAAHTGLAHAPIFTPIVGPFLKGLAVTTYFSPVQLAKRATPQDKPLPYKGGHAIFVFDKSGRVVGRVEGR